MGRDRTPGVAGPLGRFLRDRHAIDLDPVDGLVPVEGLDPGQWLEDLHGPAELVRVVRAQVPPPALTRP